VDEVEHHLNDKRTVKLWNRTKKNYPCSVDNLSDAVKGAEIVHIVVSDPPTVYEILERIVPHLSKGALVVQSSTISPKWAQKNADLVGSKGFEYVEAPFTGSKVGAAQRQLVFFIGGKESAKLRAIPLLQYLSRKIFDMGSEQKASAVKLAMNLNIAGVGQALIESFTLAREYDIPEKLYFDVLANNVSRSGVSDMKQEKLLHRDYSAHFSTKHMHKDVNLAVESAKGDLPVTRQVREVYQRGLNEGLGDSDFISLVQLFEADKK
jgi:3-hydroxyisobutyrate dehydrogenase-like beta-hydroxyacid dehydrogenase